ncbi:MAG: hypothetical protein KC486_16650 [Myxococcales bacterium]|nr:hypothetical protein [Myxococcales bacterium]
MLPESPCTRTRLAAAKIGNVDACSCGMIHLNLGATTLRFTPTAFELLGAMIDEARRERAAADDPLIAAPRELPEAEAGGPGQA